MIIELDKLRQVPCNKWLRLFEDGKLNVQKAFEDYGVQYAWLYKNSDYDLIAWEIENECFNWWKDSWLLAYCCPDNLNPELFNWYEDSWAVAEHCAEHFDKDLFNWEGYSHYVVKHCPEHFDPKLYNWKDFSWVVEKYCPELLHLKPKKI